ncbi:MAG TPA: hypothetical protein VGL59_05480 [Polyangia bacterium]
MRREGSTIREMRFQREQSPPPNIGHRFRKPNNQGQRVDLSAAGFAVPAGVPAGIESAEAPTVRVFYLAAALAAAACTSTPATPAAPAAPIVAGDVALGLQVSQGVAVSAATYTITGNGITPLTGSIPLGDPAATASVLVGGIPAGMAYLFTIDASTDDGETTCHGSAIADVIADATSGVTIILQCRRPSQLGGVSVNVTINNCPTIAAASAAPLAVAVGGTIKLASGASDLDNDPLTFQWTVSGGGTLDPPAAPNTIFTCTDERAVTVRLAVSDGACQDQTTIPINCLPFCAFHPDGTACNDHNACTHTDRCAGGQCVGSDAVVCVVADQCHLAGICDPVTALCSNPTLADGTMCTLPNASAACGAGMCDLQTCAPGFGNCDGADADGCEVSLLTSANNCGHCGLQCAVGASCTAGLCLSPPPIGVTAQAGGWTVAIGWQAAPGATGYQVFRATAAGGPFQQIGQTAAATSFVDQAIATGAAYFYAVATVSAGGVSPDSTVVPVTPLPKQLCVTASQGHSVSVYDATQTGKATPVRTITGSSTGFGFPKGVASSPTNGELFVSLQGGLIEAFSMTSNGNVAPAWILSGAVGGTNVYAIDVDPVATEAFTAEYEAGGAVSVLASDTGVLKRRLSGAQTQLGHVSSVVVDRDQGELFVGQLDPSGAFQELLTFDLAASGDVAPKRTLGSSASATGAWAVAYDSVHDELFTTSNANNKVTVFDRTASDGAAPKRTLQITGLNSVYGLLLDVASDTLWAVGSSGFTTVMIVEVPRGADGAVSPLRTGISLNMIGRIARCN